MGHNTLPNRYKKSEIIPCVLVDHDRLKVDNNSNRNNIKYAESWILSNTLYY